MSTPPQHTTQSYYYNSPYPPVLVPTVRCSQIPSQPSSQYTSTSDSSSPSSPPPTKKSFLQLAQIPTASISNSSPSCTAVQSYHNHQNQLQQNHQQHTQNPCLEFPVPQPVHTAHISPQLPTKVRSVKPLVASSRKTRTQASHPYARPLSKKDDDVKRRQKWNHTFEKFIFSPLEITTMGAPQRRAIYISSLEAHINHMHDRLVSMDCWPVDRAEVESFSGLNSKTAKSLVAGLQYDASMFKLKLLNLERDNRDLQKILSNMRPKS